MKVGIISLLILKFSNDTLNNGIYKMYAPIKLKYGDLHNKEIGILKKRETCSKPKRDLSSIELT